MTTRTMMRVESFVRANLSLLFLHSVCWHLESRLHSGDILVEPSEEVRLLIERRSESFLHRTGQ